MSRELHAKLQNINQQVDAAKKRCTELENALKQNQQLLENLQAQDSLYSSLATTLDDINKVDRLGGASLLWGDNNNLGQALPNKQHITSALQKYKTQCSTAHKQGEILKQEYARFESLTNALLTQQMDLQDEFIAQQEEFVIEREITLRGPEPDTLPWSDEHSDSIRFRVIMLAVLCIAALIGYLIPMWKIPEVEQTEYIEIPERMVRLLMKKVPPPPKPVAEKKPQEEIEPPESPEDKTAREKEKVKVARNVAEKTGMLAFKHDFAEMIGSSSDLKIGAQAAIIKEGPGQYSGRGGHGGRGGRSLVTSRLQLSDSGTNTKSVQRTKSSTNVSTENSLNKVKFSHIESQISKAEDSKPQRRHDSVKPTRSDDEIQIVFDRYKDALYRIYNRELRKKPLLKGKLVLRLTIEPGGTVSKCIIDFSDLDAPELENKIVARVLKFNFGEKQGADKLTILYPIDFLPAS